uniref:TBC1 domain protein n=1 Tax=Anoplophora glabripennis TaxID=217634 RepID=V5I966_ANOGL
MPEEEAFAVLVKIMEDFRMRDMFKPSMAELGLCMFQLENLVAEYLPDLNQHFQSQNFHTSMYASSWFLTLFTTALSLPLACRIMDVFLSEGMEIIFKVALAMLTLGKEELMSLDMEGMLKYFQKELPGRAEADPESLMQSAYSMKYNAKKMKKLEKEYNVIKTKEQEEMAELKRLRQENKQLRHRCEMLEEESKALADRLVRGQVSRAEEEETTFVVQRELDVLRHTHLETTHQLALANEKIRSLSLMMEETHTSRQSSMEEITLKQEQLQQREEMIECLQEELVKVRLREAENDALIRDLRSRIHELEEDKKTLREITPDNSVAHLQEELIAVKLREAEANLSLKDLRQRVSELSNQWQRHLQLSYLQEHKQEPTSSSDAHSTPKKLLFWENRHNETQKLEEELMTTRIREMETLTEVKELRLKVMELETQVQVSTNQLRRQDEEIKKQRESLEAAELRDREAAARLLEEQRRYSDLESKMQDELMKAKISDAEKTQAVAELTQKISQLELKSQEIATEGELRIHSVDDSDKVRDLQDKVADLQAEWWFAELPGGRVRWGLLYGDAAHCHEARQSSAEQQQRLPTGTGAARQAGGSQPPLRVRRQVAQLAERGVGVGAFQEELRHIPDLAHLRDELHPRPHRGRGRRGPVGEMGPHRQRLGEPLEEEQRPGARDGPSRHPPSLQGDRLAAALRSH